MVRGLRNRGIGVLLVGQRFVAEALHGIGDKDAPDARGAAQDVGRSARGSREHENQREDADDGSWLHLNRSPGDDGLAWHTAAAALGAFESRLIHVGRHLRIGVLALQGAFREHAKALRTLGADVVEVRLPEELDGLDGLVIPGGESTTIVRLAELYGLDEAIRAFGGPVFGTCAGMIVVDREHLGLADLVVERNAFGRQVRSFEADVDLTGDAIPLRGVFIRAPRIRSLGDDVEVIGELDGEPVLVRDGRFLLASFHPELTDDLRVHESFLTMVEEASRVGA